MYIGSNLTAVARLAQESETAWIYTQVGRQMTSFTKDYKARTKVLFTTEIEPSNFSAALEVQRLQAESI